MPKSQAKVINTFTPEQIVKLSSAYQEGANPSRDLAIMLLMLDCGLRVSELVSINVDDVNLVRGLRKDQRGKGKQGADCPYRLFYAEDGLEKS